MANAPSAASRRSVNVKRWILAALGAILILIAVVIIISIVLRPDDIDFSITHASNNISNDGMTLSLTLAVHNPSKRAEVQYRSILIYLQYTIETAAYRIPTNINNDLTKPEWQPRQRTARIDVSAFLSEEDYPQNGSAPDIGVLVITVVRFKVRTGCSTWPYNVRLSCLPTNYSSPQNLSFPINCTA